MSEIHENAHNVDAAVLANHIPSVSDWSREDTAPLHKWFLENDLSLESLANLLGQKHSLSPHAVDPRIIVADGLADIDVLQETRGIKALLIALDNQDVVQRAREIDAQGRLDGLRFRFTIASDPSGVSFNNLTSSVAVPAFLQCDVFRLAEIYMQASGVKSAVASLEHFPDNAPFGVGHYDGNLSSPYSCTNMSYDYLGDGTMLMPQSGRGIKPGADFINIFRGPSKDTPEECGQFHVQTGGRRLRLLISGQVPVCPQEMVDFAIKAGVNIPNSIL